MTGAIKPGRQVRVRRGRLRTGSVFSEAANFQRLAILIWHLSCFKARDAYEEVFFSIARCDGFNRTSRPNELDSFRDASADSRRLYQHWFDLWESPGDTRQLR